MQTIEGVYKNGQVVLAKVPENVEESKVLVSFLDTKQIDLRERGIDKEQAAELRGKFSAIAEDWERPEMDIYDIETG